MERLIRSLETAPVVDRGDYEYFVHPVTDGIPQVEPALLREISDAIVDSSAVEGVDKILTAEAMGIHITTALSLATDLPFVIARKRSYGFEDEVPVHQETGYSENELYVNGIEPGDRLVVVDDVLSTGNTLAALTAAAERRDASVESIVVVIRRDADEDVVELPAPVTHLVAVDVADGTVRIRDSLAD